MTPETTADMPSTEIVPLATSGEPLAPSEAVPEVEILAAEPIEVASGPEPLPEQPETIASDDDDDDGGEALPAEPIEEPAEDVPLPLAAAEVEVVAAPAPEPSGFACYEAELPALLERFDAAFDRELAKALPELQELFEANLAAQQRLVESKEQEIRMLTREIEIMRADNREELQARQRRADQLNGVAAMRPRVEYYRDRTGRIQRR